MSDVEMKKKNVTDMTEGNPTKLMLWFAIPLFIGNMFQQFYNMIDSLVVGNYVGADALAAIGTCGSLNFLFFSLSFGLANGAGVIVSHYFGAKDESGIRSTISNAFYVLVVASMLATTLGFVLARPLLTLMHTPENIINDSVLYLRVTVCGVLFIATYNGVAAILRALGDSKTPLIFLIISSFLNIGMDLLLVLKFQMGVYGVGLATVIAQAISAAVSLSYAFIKVPYFKLSKEELKPHRKIIMHAIRLGVPMAVQSSMIATSMIVLQGVVNGFGTVVMAAYTITAKVDLIISQFYQAISNALITYAGQNQGAGRTDRVKMGYKRGILMVTIYNLVFIPIIFALSGPITSVFVSEADLAVVDFGAQAMRITSICYFALGLIYVPRGILNGVGDAKFSLINGITEVICRILYANVLTRIAFIDVWGIWLAAGLTWATVAVVCHLRYLKGHWEEKQIA